MSDLKILVLPPPSLCRKLFSPASEAALRSFGNVRFNQEERNVTSDELVERLRDVNALVTGWRSPRIAEDAIAASPDLQLIAHTAGSVKFMISESLLRNGRPAVTTAAAAMGEAVAEMAL